MRLSSKIVLGWAQQIETNGAAFYQQVAAQAKDRDVKLLFADLAAQEERHHRLYGRMLARVPDTELVGPDLEGYQDYLKVALADALFGSPEKGIERARAAATEQEAIAAALAFERDTLLFFIDLVEMMPEAHRAAIAGIIAEEKGHVRQLSRMLADHPWVS